MTSEEPHSTAELPPRPGTPRPVRSVLFLAQLPPPHHGQSAMAAAIYEFLELEASCTMRHSWRGGARKANDVGKRRLGKYLGFVGLLAQLLFDWARGRRYDLAYLGMAPWAHTLWRDALLVSVAKLLADRCWLHVHGQGLEAILSGPGPRNALLRRMLGGTELIAMTDDVARAGAASGLFRRVIPLANMAPDPGQQDPIATPQDGIAQRRLHIGCLGNLDPRKGVIDFVDTVDALVADGLPVTATIVGGDTAALTASQLRAHIQELGADRFITVAGRVSEAEKSRLLKDFDVFLYLSHHDLAPLAVIEALAHGCAPILLDIGGLRDMVGRALADQVLPAEADTAALYPRIHALISAYCADPVRLAQTKAEARLRYVDKFSPARFYQALAAALGEDTAPTRIGGAPSLAGAGREAGADALR